MKNNPVYFNNPQRLTQLIGAHTTVVVAGRRTGKTDSIATPFVLRNMQRMPGSTGGIVVPTFKHGMSNTIPGLLAALERWGYKRGKHYEFGKQPPKGFKRPIIEPLTYEHVLSFYNGSIAIMLSQDRPGAANGLTLSWLLIDEARFIDYLKLKEEVLPANGGIKSHFGAHSFNHSMMILSDMPRSQKGSWFLKYREQMNPELIKLIKGIVYEIWDLRRQREELIAAGQEVPTRLKNKIRKLDKQLNQLRSVAVYYVEYSSIENLQLLGENYIRQMRRDLTPLSFQTSILCRRPGFSKSGFYSSMTPGLIYDSSYRAVADTIGAPDINPDEPLCIGMDYNANINCVVVGQPSGRRLNVVDAIFVKYERKLPALVSDFCARYFNHPTKQVIFYYDTTALGANYAVNDQDFYWVICNEFEQNGWSVIPVYLGNPMAHHEKYLLINQSFGGKQRLTPYFNGETCATLIAAMKGAGVVNGSKGFKKDKSGEKAPETEENPLELRTDITDAFDTLYIGCEKFPESATSRMGIYGVG